MEGRPVKVSRTFNEPRADKRAKHQHAHRPVYMEGHHRVQPTAVPEKLRTERGHRSWLKRKAHIRLKERIIKQRAKTKLSKLENDNDRP